MSTAVAERSELETAEDRAPDGGRWQRLYAIGIAIVVVAGIVMRFLSVPPLWLDEAQGVAIARMPVPDMFQGLREDGAPPLYYLMLHVWTAVFGTGDFSVRAMSGVISAATLPLFWFAGTRLTGSRRVGHLSLVLAAANPWLIRYGSEGRMYSLVILLGLLVILAAHEVWAAPTVRAGVLLAVSGALLLYTHYWGLFLLAALGTMGLVKFLRGDRRQGLVAIIGLAGAGVLFLPWLPSFLFQAAHTGTPWADRPYPNLFLFLLQEWSAAGFRAVSWIALLLWPLLMIGYAGIRTARHKVELDLRGDPPTRWLAWVAVLTLLIAYAACTVQRAAYTGRYTSVMFGILIVIAALGLTRLPSRYMIGGTALFAVCWLAAGASVTVTPRSQAGHVARVLNDRAATGDMVVFCPDQLGPSVTRLLTVPVNRTAFPTGQDPSRVNWVDYRQRNQSASASAFAANVVARTPGGASIWLVSTEGYRTYGDSCAQLQQSFDDLRGNHELIVRNSSRYYERAGLRRWGG